jgi:hypothetical protein
VQVDADEVAERTVNERALDFILRRDSGGRRGP